MPPRIVRCSLKNYDKSTHVSPHLTQSLRRLVTHERKEVLSVFLDGVDMDGTFGSMERFAQMKWLKTKGDKHNDPKIRITGIPMRSLSSASPLMMSNSPFTWI